MKKLFLSLFVLLLLSFGFANRAQADEYLRIGMEAAYAPFNWTQDDDKNGAIKIEGTNQYANGYDNIINCRVRPEHQHQADDKRTNSADKRIIH